MNKPRDVKTYINGAPRESRRKLRQLRNIIRAAAPQAQERISYGMPYYQYEGRLAYFMLHTNHIGLYIPTPVVAEHRKELKPYETSQATIRFPLNEPLPVRLIQKLIKARMRKNEENS